MTLILHLILAIPNPSMSSIQEVLLPIKELVLKDLQDEIPAAVDQMSSMNTSLAEMARSPILRIDLSPI